MFRSPDNPHAIDMRLATEADWVRVFLTPDQIRNCNNYARTCNAVSVADLRKDNHNFSEVATGMTDEHLHEASVPSGMAVVVYVCDGDERGMRAWTPINSFGIRGNVGWSLMTPLSTRTRDTTREPDQPDLRLRGEYPFGILILCDHDPGTNVVTLKGWKLAFECVLVGRRHGPGPGSPDAGRPSCHYVRPSLLYPMSALKDILRYLGPNSEGWLIPEAVFPSCLDPYKRRADGTTPIVMAGVPWPVRLQQAWDEFRRQHRGI